MAENNGKTMPRVRSRCANKLVVLTGGKVLNPPEPIKKYPKAKYPKDRRRPGNRR